ncbi:unnamed protein product [Mesocestoides corti]|uniref:Uncharacterized protein n=1 Tax=Mesocestoides corti TaxID=53468 RepID=A0A3P6GY63_MESCO|nr:unnamed protein product [Mesocestoides corti]
MQVSGRRRRGGRPRSPTKHGLLKQQNRSTSPWTRPPFLVKKAVQ